MHADVQRRSVAGAILLIALVGTMLSLIIPLLAVETERRGISAVMAGLNTAVGGLGTLLAAPYVPRVAARIGADRAVFAAILLTAASTLSFVVLPFWAWFPVRFLFGVGLCTMFVLSEYWINAAAPPERRGFIMGIYATVLALGFALGPFTLVVLGTTGWVPYLAGAVLVLLAIIPMSFVDSKGLPLHADDSTRVLPFLFAVPVATFAGLVFGAVETAGFALLPVYGLRSGFNETDAALLVGIVAGGNVLSQMPIGWLADRFDRRKLLLALTLLATVAASTLPFVVAERPLLYAMLFIFGGTTGGFYTVGLAHLGARYSGIALASANAAFVMLYSIGLIAGPPVAGAAMDALGPVGLPVTLVVMTTIYAGLVVARLRQP